MAQKIRPTALRLGITAPWKSRWFFKKPLRYFIQEDHAIRLAIREKILAAGIADITVERTLQSLRVTIKAARPGLVIGRGGKGIEELRAFIERRIRDLRKKRGMNVRIAFNINVEELKRNEVSAAVTAQQIASDMERRLPFRMVMKRSLESLRQNRGVGGAKIRIAGRLNGAEISRAEWLSFGRMPAQTLRADIDYGEATSFNTYGTVGVKVWIYKGDIFEE